ncbi:MAG: hypothetical protein M1822_004721 [Bathelium mastoideum]|nr:MAG: hypothetical protein M1822_004721 [Bathelium mastoideum]
MSPPTNLYDEGLHDFRDNVKIKDDKDQYILDEFLKDKASPEEVVVSCKGLQDKAGEKYGSIKSGDKEIIPAKWISNILGNIDNFVAVGNFAMKGAPESVGMAWFAVKLCLSAIESNYNLYALFGSGLTDTTEIMVLIRHYDRLYDERQKPGWKSSDIVDKLFKDIRATYAAVLDFSYSIKKHLSGGKLAKLRHGFKDFFGAEASKFQAKIDAIGDLKKKVLEATDGAFQGKTFQRFDDLQDLMKSMKSNVQDIKDFQKTSEEFYHAQLAQQDEIRQALEDLKANTRPRTRWDWAKQEFEKNKKLLNPLADTGSPIDTLLARKHDGTCDWIFKDDEFNDWYSSSVSNMFCLTGEAGVGKSIVLASVMKNLEDDVNPDQCIVLYVSCDMLRNGEMGDGFQSLARISNTLIYQLYENATGDEDNPTLLENCNKVFTNPKQKKVSKVLSANKKEESLPDFADAMDSLAINFEKEVCIVIDAVDRMTDEDQEELFNNLQDLVGRGENDDDDDDVSHVTVLVGCRTGSKFYGHARDGASLDVGQYNGDDIKLKLTAELDKMPGWSASEKEEAQEKILDKAASLFKYVSQVAIPFIQQPFQRPLSNRLKELPEGMSETYNQAIRGMAPNYLDLLRTALSWTLLAPGPVKVLEVMEAFTGEYLVPKEDALKKIDAEKEDGSYDKMASQLEITQLRTASGPFLNIWEESGGQSFVSLKDPYQVKHFCLHATEHVEAEEVSGDTICTRCKASLNPSRSLSISEKQGHLDLAITLVRHLNSPLFQQRFNLLIDEDEKQNASTDGKTPEDEGYSSAPGGEGNETEAENAAKANEDVNGEEETDDKQGDQDKTVENASDKAQLPDQQIDDTKTEDGKESPPNKDDVDDPDESMDDEDRGDIDLTSKGNDDSAAASQNTENQNIRYLRYEVMRWDYHVREAESLWKPEERAGNKDWATLMSELDRFTDENAEAFGEWQIFMFWQNGHRRGDEPWKPIHIAAYLGLTSWAEHLIARGANLKEKSFNINPLQAAALKAESPSMLKLLLEHDVDLNDEEEDVIPGFHAWLWDDASYDSMELMIKNGADLKLTDKKNGWAALHYLASQGDDPKVLELMMNKADPQNQPNINAEDRDGETPLHVLLSRREVPTELLKAFIANNADVNAEDKDSQRPLQQASIWGDANTIRILLPHVSDIDDPDTKGRTALHEAAWAGYKECVQLLIENHANPNGTDKHNRTPLLFACLGTSQHAKDTIKFLLDTLRQRKVPITEINMTTKRSRTPLRQAAAHGFTDTVKDLLEMIKSAENIDRAAMINLVDTRKGRSALHCAAYRGQTDCVRLLLEHGAGVNIQDHDGKTPLVLSYDQWALSNQSSFEDIVDLLIDKDPDTAVKDAELLATAAVNGSKRILEKLHGLDANLNKPDQYGWTPLMLARQFHRADAIHFLKRQASWAATLPSRWSKPPTDITLSEGGHVLRTESEARMVISANKPLPAGLERFYFEVTSRQVDIDGVEVPEYPEMAIGFCTLGASAITFPGWPPATRAPNARSWAYHGDDGGMGDSATRFDEDEDRKYKPGDTIGCGVDFNKNKMWFTKNGEKLEWEFSDVRGRLFPLLGVAARVDLETNFGTKPFVWQDDGGQSDEDSDADDESSESGDGSGSEDSDGEGGSGGGSGSGSEKKGEDSADESE